MTRNEGERLAVMEATGDAIMKKLDEMSADLKAIRKDLDEDKADLAALKNKGAGVLIGVGLLGGGIGAAVSGVLDKLLN